ncbi:MAG TPA: M23 family metallopeptidase [Capillimicrobium sp.]|jgi:hypothetical protein
MPVGRRSALTVACAALLALALALAGPAAAVPDSKAKIVPLGMTIENAPTPVAGADGRNHLAYEITIVNQTPGEVTIGSVQARAGGKPIGARLSGESLSDLLRVNNGEGPAIPSGGSALLFMDVRYPLSAPRPKRLTHRFTMSLAEPPQPLQRFAFDGVPTAVGQGAPIEVAPPLRGDRWVAANGCCNPINAHRGATLSIDGTVHVPERFAIDWVKLDPSDRLFTGAIGDLSSYAYFGEPVHSATAGKVVTVVDNLPEQTPGALPAGATVQNAGGNHIVVRFGPKRFAFYAHLQPNSPTVKPGDRVRVGQVLGKLGNTGNTDAPHLHFHVMDGPSPLQSNGLPFVHTGFTGTGQVSDESLLQSGEVVPIDANVLDGTFRERMPMGLQVVDFGP